MTEQTQQKIRDTYKKIREKAEKQHANAETCACSAAALRAHDKHEEAEKSQKKYEIAIACEKAYNDAADAVWEVLPK